MELTERLEKDFLTALKARREDEVSVLRMAKTALKNKQVELRRPLTDEDTLAVLAKEVKLRNEAFEQFNAAGRTELARKEAREAEILMSYLPRPLTPEELEQAVRSVAAELGAGNMKDMGRVMQEMSVRYKGRYDGRTASDLVRALLAG